MNSAHRPAINVVRALLQNAEFCEDARQLIAKAAALREQVLLPEEWQRRTGELAQPFLARWGVLPPQTGELLDADPRRRVVETIAAGRWGVVLVFPWTKDRDIRRLVTQIQKAIGKRHQDALFFRLTQLVRWLEVCGFPRPEIARAVFGRRTGLRRSTKDEAIGGISEDRERQLYRE